MTSDRFEKRVQNLREQIVSHTVDAMLLTEMPNIAYITGFTGSAAYAFVTPDEAILITDGRYTLRAQAECPQFSVIIAAGSGGYQEALKDVLESRPSVTRLSFESNHVTVAQWETFKNLLPTTLKLVPADSLIEALRMVKDADEIAAIRNAIVVAEQAFITIQPLLRPGVSEREVAIELEFAMRRGGAQKASFETIVASGEQGAHPHHTPNERRLQSGDLVTIDWGANVDGYCSDITRTIAIGTSESFTDQQRQIYEVVLQAQQAAIAAIAPGKTGREIDSVARQIIADAGYGDAFAHSLGHSLGRDVHDGPGFSARSASLILQPGMVMTVEPGIYLPDLGGVRIEEDVLVTDTGCEILTHLPNHFQSFS